MESLFTERDEKTMKLRAEDEARKEITENFIQKTTKDIESSIDKDQLKQRAENMATAKIEKELATNPELTQLKNIDDKMTALTKKVEIIEKTVSK
jgi:hypothetical protein